MAMTSRNQLDENVSLRNSELLRLADWWLTPRSLIVKFYIPPKSVRRVTYANS